MAETLRTQLEAQGRTVTWLATKTGYSRGYTSNVVNGVNPMTEDFRKKVLQALGDTGNQVDLFRGETVRIPDHIYRRRAPSEVVADGYESAWKQAWVRKNGDTALAVAAERAWQAALADPTHPAQ